MKVSIDITEAVNGYRFDLYDDRKSGKQMIYRENVQRYEQVLNLLLNFVKAEAAKRPIGPTTMGVI